MNGEATTVSPQAPIMRLTALQKVSLGVGGVVALSICALILTVPRAFYASYGIALAPDPSLLNELRALGAGIVVLGAAMLAGVMSRRWTPFGIAAALTVYIAFPGGRLVGIAMDGVPNASILGALAIEVVIATMCLTAFARPLRRGHATA